MTKDERLREQERTAGVPDGRYVAPASTRRVFLARLGTGLTALGGVVLTIPLLRYLIGPGLGRTRQGWISLGPIEGFAQGETHLTTYRNPFAVSWDGATADIPCYVRRIAREEFQVFSIHCTHLGCPVRWFSESGLFLCPCHGGVFYEDGRRAAGPPPRGLYQYRCRVRDGSLEVRGGQIPTLSEPL